MNRTARLLLLKNEWRCSFTSPMCLPGVTGTTVVVVVIIIVIIIIIIVVVVLLVAVRK